MAQDEWFPARIHEIEKAALCGDRDCILQCISLERRLRQACMDVLATRHADGAIDGANAAAFENDCMFTLHGNEDEE